MQVFIYTSSNQGKSWKFYIACHQADADGVAELLEDSGFDAAICGDYCGWEFDLEVDNG